MTRPSRVAVVGATGLVGQTLLTVLGERFPGLEHVRALAECGGGRTVQFAGRTLPVEAISEEALAEADDPVMRVTGTPPRQATGLLAGRPIGRRWMVQYTRPKFGGVWKWMSADAREQGLAAAPVAADEAVASRDAGAAAGSGKTKGEPRGAEVLAGQARQ